MFSVLIASSGLIFTARTGCSKHLARVNDSLFRERLDVAIPMSTGPEVKKYSCVKAGIDSEKLGYFALSMLWRGAIHEWQDPLGSPIPKLDLGDMEEPMRRYLLGDGPFPDGIVVIVRVCDDSMSRETLINPIPAGGVDHYEMLTLGVQFEMFVGAAIDPQCRELCCVSSTDKWIFRRNCRKRTLGHYVDLERTSQRSKQVIAEWPG